MKSGTNNFHGSGWYFLQRARYWTRDDFFNPASIGPKPEHARDQGGFSIGGPIRKNKTFFFADIEKVRDNEPQNIVASVPTLAERTGDFRGRESDLRPNHMPARLPDSATGGFATGWDAECNSAGRIDPIGQAIINLYPKPNLPGEFSNFRTNALQHADDYQFDIKVDHQISGAQRLSGRYSRLSSNFSIPTVLGDGDTWQDGIASTPTHVQNISLEHAWTVNPKIVWTNRFAVDRVWEKETDNYPSLTSVGLPSYLAANAGVNRMPTMQMSGPIPGPICTISVASTQLSHTLCTATPRNS